MHTNLRRLILCLPLIISLAACGNNNSDSIADDFAAADLGERAPILTQTEWAAYFNSPAYTGKLAVRFAEGTGAQLANGRLTSSTGVNLNSVQTLLDAIPGLTIEAELPSDLHEQSVRTRLEAAQRGVTRRDWGLDYRITLPSTDRAEQLMLKLSKNRAVSAIYPIMRSMLLGGVTPNIEAQQSYLAAGDGGLNIPVCWAEGLSGKGIQIVDIDFAWNYGHEDLSISAADLLHKAITPVKTDIAIQHGTATLGIIGAKDNGIGVKGIAYGAKLQTAESSSYEFPSALGELDDNVSEYQWGKNPLPKVKPGTIVVIETGVGTPQKGSAEGCVNAETGQGGSCLPEEANPKSFSVIQQAVASGLVVIEGAGNGGFDLGSDAAFYGDFPGLPSPHLGVESTGAIMVGASTGADMKKLSSSNCGTRVDVYAWGNGVATSGVVSTGYGDLGFGNDQNQWYTNAKFYGTSAATAQIAGVAALLQEYVQKLYVPQIKPSQGVYLNTAQMRDVLVKSGAGREAKETNGCSIGVQPDVGKAIQLLKDGVVKPTIYDRPQNACPYEGWCDSILKQPALAKAFDLDGDARADLISFSRDHKWYVDLSSKGSGGDNYGSWDLVLDPGALPDGMYFPVVGDYNTDGKADLAVYNSTTGKWYIRYTDSQILANNWGAGWSKVIDYSTDPNWQPYSRPVPGDYDGADNNAQTFDQWLDPAVVTPNGHLLIDIITQAEANQSGEVLGTCERNIAFLSPEQTAAAPEWVYLPFATGTHVSLVVPPSLGGLPKGEWFVELGSVFGPWWEYEEDGKTGIAKPWEDWKIDAASVFTLGDGGTGFKQPDGSWLVTMGLSADGEKYTGYINDGLDFGNLTCRPVQADFDGDGAPDRAVQCPTEWRIEYSDHIFPPGVGFLRTVPMSTKPLDPLTGYVYPGGVAYTDVKSIIEYYLAKLGCKTADGKLCTVFDLTKTTNPSTGQLYSPPVGPYLPQCLKYWSTQPLNCLNY